MILMYHHVCSSDEIPLAQVPLEGWKYKLEPAAFDSQLRAILARGYRFVTLKAYLAEMAIGGSLFSTLATVTFDDGWLDNFTNAFPILTRLDIPATFFVVSGEMQGISWDRRMTPDQLRKLLAAGMTIGAHTRSHPNLASLDHCALRDEVYGAKLDLERLTGVPVEYLAYPGGRFSQKVVQAAQDAGYLAACSVINWGQNTEASRYWLYRDVFRDRLDGLSDKLRLNQWTRRMFGGRAKRSLQKMLAGDV